jgi:hypothetical protein
MLRTKLCLAVVTIAATTVSLSCESNVVGQRPSVYGTVSDADTGERLEGVLVEMKGRTDLTNSQPPLLTVGEVAEILRNPRGAS